MYLSKFTQVQDKLVVVGETVPDKDLVSLALLGHHMSWQNFQDADGGKENILG